MQIDPNIHRSAQFGNLKFPTREDYVQHLLNSGVVAREEEIWLDEKFVTAIHRHWHAEGRNGCIFALLAARRASELGWEDYVITDRIEDIEANKNFCYSIHERIQEAIQNPECEVLSLLFSNINADESLVRLISTLLNVHCVMLAEQAEYNDMLTLALRVPLLNSEILSWLMAFGPFLYFPQTRQSPLTEIAIRVKPKPKIQFHRLSKEKEAAHLADLPVDYKDEVMEKTWKNTERRTRLILGGEPDHFSAAKTTFTVPKAIWYKFNK